MIPIIPLLLWPRFHGRTRSPERGHQPGPLREFVYLDEVSLRSLLASQAGEIKDTVSEQYESAILGELSLKAAGGVPFAAGGEAGTRFQTNNSSTFLTSRKATVQSWFKDLHSRSELRLISPMNNVSPVGKPAELADVDNPSIVVASTALERGSLTEFRVKLAAHPAFHLTTMMTEFAAVAEDFGTLLPADARGNFQKIVPMIKVLQRLLVGLIPIHAEAADHVVVEIDEVEYVVHRGAISGLNLASKPLVIVGVTDQGAYWKDIRRVLFSGATFTMLCRVSRSGLHQDWVPVKLMDIFSKVVPDFPKQISAAWQIPFDSKSRSNSNAATDKASPLEIALVNYSTALLARSRRRRTEEEIGSIKIQVLAAINGLKLRTGSVSDQKSAFVAVKTLLAEIAGVRISAATDVKLREDARAIAGLSFFPGSANPTAPTSPPSFPTGNDNATAYLDTEVVAIYW